MEKGKLRITDKTTIANAVTEKYLKKLKQLISDVTEPTFRTSKWMVTNQLDVHFVEKAIELGYIKPVSKIGNRIVYAPCTTADEIGINDAIRLQMAVRKKAREVKFKDTSTVTEMSYEEAVRPVHEPTIKDSMVIQQLGLESFTSAELVEELKKRGFTGMIEKLEKFEF